jgi:hypothetical protein
MNARCPEGHTSSTTDFCDVCGTPIESESAGSPALSPTPPASTSSLSLPQPETEASPRRSCPNCEAANAADAFFCEDCGYDFATGQLPAPPTSVEPAPERALPRPALGPDWVAEVWIDPDWFSHQRAEGICPTSGLPVVVPLSGSVALIGRRSTTRNITPDIDCSNDGAISHRHAELSRSGQRWSVKDLGSTNGTFIGRPVAGFPDDSLSPQQARELADDERIYVGAWTRIVVRAATDAEKAGTA